MSAQACSSLLCAFLLLSSGRSQVVSPLFQGVDVSPDYGCIQNSRLQDSDALAQVISQIQDKLPPEGCEPTRSFRTCLGPTETPLQINLNANFTDDSYIYLRFTTPVTGRFSVNLLTPANDLHLIHINPRVDIQVFVMNHRINGMWQDEVRPTNYPWTGTTVTTMLIEIETQEGGVRAYKITVNDIVYSYPIVPENEPNLATRVFIGQSSDIVNFNLLTAVVGPAI